CASASCCCIFCACCISCCRFGCPPPPRTGVSFVSVVAFETSSSVDALRAEVLAEQPQGLLLTRLADGRCLVVDRLVAGIEAVLRLVRRRLLVPGGPLRRR